MYNWGWKSFCLLIILSSAIPTVVFCQNVPNCGPNNCKLPNCRCSGVDIPGNLERSQTPQFVLIGFDAAVNFDNFALYGDLLDNRKNPNGQPITATFFVSHDYTIYSMLHQLYRKGHEIALNSISGHSANATQDYWRYLNETMWKKEMVDQRQQISTFARIPMAEIQGARAPQLEIGGDEMYRALNKAKIKWDCSRPTSAFRKTGLWPYTNDYQSIQDCFNNNTRCPAGQHSGFWSVPIINYVSGHKNNECSLADQCVPEPQTANATFDLLYNNFLTHYEGHRSPFGLFTRHGWINGTEDPIFDYIWQRRLGYVRFLDYLATLNDVYIVSISRVLDWVQNPVSLADVANFPSFHATERPDNCKRSFSCHYLAGETPFKPPFSLNRNFQSCTTCPLVYPWVGNHLGRMPYQ